MIYILNELVCYCTEDGSIKNRDGDGHDVVLLTPIPNRILQILLENQGQVITRDRFLIEVWDQYGRTGSLNTLKQYIGLIRKLLYERLNIDCIITIPRQGYTFSPDVKVSVIQEGILHKPALNSKDIATSNDIQKSKSVLSKVYSNYFSLGVYFWNTSAIVFVILLSMQIHNILIEPKYLDVYPLKDIGNCRMYGMSIYDSPTQSIAAVEKVNALFSKDALMCSVGDKVYFYSNYWGEEKHAGNYSILSKCAINYKEDIGCVTYRTNRQ